MEGLGKRARCGAESTPQVTIRKTVTTTDWRAGRGSACLVPAPKCIRPDLQAEPFDVVPSRALFPSPAMSRGIRCAVPCRRFAPGFALRARAAACCLMGVATASHFSVTGYEWRGAARRSAVREPPCVSIYTGERLAMGSTAIGSAPSRMSTCGSVATGPPIASRPVASRSPVTRFHPQGSRIALRPAGSRCRLLSSGWCFGAVLSRQWI